jgi:hypothetical protein
MNGPAQYHGSLGQYQKGVVLEQNDKAGATDASEQLRLSHSRRTYAVAAVAANDMHRDFRAGGHGEQVPAPARASRL